MKKITYPRPVTTYRGVEMRCLSITQVEVRWRGKLFLADGALDAMRLIDDLIATQEF